MENNKINDEIEIDLSQILQLFIKKIWLIVLGLIVGAVIAFSYTSVFIAPLYSADVKMYVNSGGISVGSVSISSSDLTLSRTLIDTYTTILQTRSTLNKIIEEGDLDYTTDELLSMISAESLNDTEVFQITVVSTDPYEAEHIANVIALVLPDQIADTIMDSTILVLDYAITPVEPISPNVVVNTVIGAFLGTFAVLAALLLIYFTRQQITSVDELAYISKAPVLTIVPSFEMDKQQPQGKKPIKKTNKFKKGGVSK